MNKKLTAVIASIAAGGLLLGATAFAGAADNSGYQAYKTAVEKTITAKSVTPQIDVTVKDNGNLLVAVDSLMKVNKEDMSMSGKLTLTAGGQQKTVETYEQNGKEVTKSSDSNVYYVMEHHGDKMRGGKEWKGKELDSSKIKDVEKVVDALTGNLQNYITLNSGSDGTKVVNLKLTDGQIPPVVNALASMAIKNAANHDEYGQHPGGPFGVNIRPQLPKLVDAIKVNSADMTAVIGSDNLIKSQTAEITVSGKDAQGKAHEITVDVKADFTNYNNTVPDTVDLNGKQVQTISHDQEDR